MEELAADVVVAGGGVAGLMAALRAHGCGAHVVHLEGGPGASNRISGLSAALNDAPQDDPSALFTDLMAAGGFVNDPTVVAAMSNRIGTEVRYLSDLGVPFVREQGRFLRRRSAGTSWTRSIFSLGMVGVDISRAVRQRLAAETERPVVRVKHGWLAEILTEDGAVAGGLAYESLSGRWFSIRAPAVVLATGGAGRLFGGTTNPPGSRGTGYALALEAGATLVDMEFVSFEPFVAVAPSAVRGHDLPTSALSEGVRLLNGRGEEFIDTRSAPSKDVVCRAMLREVAEGRGTESGAIFYDMRAVAPESINRFVTIRQVLTALHVGPQEARVEVMPKQHYLMGGARIDTHGATDVPGLFAAGEAAGGAHGAHRVAGAGGTEAVAMGAIAGEAAAAYGMSHPRAGARTAGPPRRELIASKPSAEDRALLARIQTALDAGCGILRDAPALGAAIGEMRRVRDECDRERPSIAGRATLVALAIAESALTRTESRGDHCRTDYPNRDDANWLGNLLCRLDESRRDVALKFVRAGRGVVASVNGPSEPG